MPLTAKAITDELVVTVTDRGELESINAENVICELEGGGKLVTIKPEGTRVSKGDVVAQIDTDQFVKLLNEQKSKLQTAEGKVLEFESEVTQAKSKRDTENAKADKLHRLADLDLEAYKAPKGEFEKELQKLKGALELARKELFEAEEDLEFTKTQLSKGRGELTQVKSKESIVAQRRFNVRSSEAELTLLEEYTKRKKLTELEFNAKDALREKESTKKAQDSAVKKAENQLDTAKSQAEIERDTLKRIQMQIEQCTIKAPSDGLVLYSNRRWYGEQGMIRPGTTLQYQQPIFSLPDFSKMRVNVKIHEAMVKKIREGQTANIKLDFLPNQPLDGKVSKIGTVAQNDGYWGSKIKAYETHVTLDSVPTEAGLKPGMSAEVRVLIQKVPDAVLVPITAVSEFEGAKVVYAVVGRKIERREVEVGQENDQFVQIVKGIEPGEDVALDARSRAAADTKASGK